MSELKVAAVTGASAGIGRATALALAREGADVALLARNSERLDTLRGEIEELGRRALAIPLDVADAEAVDAAAGFIEQTLGPIDTWISCAMVSVFSPVREMTAAEYKRVTEVTYLGALHGVLAALRRMEPRKHGSIVIVGSGLAYRGIPLVSAYCAAKHALQGFNDSLQAELLHDRSNIRVTMVQLSAFNTPHYDWARSRLPLRMRPIAPVYQPEFAARAIVWAAKHGRRELKVGWPAALVIWGDKLLPRAGDWYLSRTRFGYSVQQTNEPRAANATDNLWQSVPGEFGAHGRFDRESLSSSTQFWLATHLRLLMIGIALAVLAIVYWRA
jgi:NAD(P)-dependent dehydrogenase (short-subunit alcohol dehydrogenase family)